MCLALAAVALQRELTGIDRADVLSDLRSYGALELSAALALTAASFLTLGMLELLTLRHVGEAGSARAVGRRTAITTAYMAHALSQSMGFAIFTGAAIRLRTYVGRGVGAITVARVSTFVTVTITLGLLAATGVALLGDALPGSHPAMRRVVAGVAFILAPIAYLAWSLLGRREAIGRGAWRVLRPSPALASGQILLSALDWLITGMVLFLLLREWIAVPYSTFLAAYMLAQAVGFASQIPGGLGAFDATFLAILAPRADTGALAASLVMYRVIYYLVPLAGALAMLGFSELRRRAHPAHPARPRALRV